MRRAFAVLILLALVVALLTGGSGPVESACCYFSAKDKDINQPG